MQTLHQYHQSHTAIRAENILSTQGKETLKYDHKIPINKPTIHSYANKNCIPGQATEREQKNMKKLHHTPVGQHIPSTSI
jgi:hypothetical protein